MADAVDEILEEARIESSKRPKPKSNSKKSKTSDSKDESIIPTTDKDISELSNGDPSVTGANRAEKQAPRTGPPTVPPPPPPSSVQTVSIQDDNEFEANFEVNFDEAFGEPTPELPKQLGGRASIPDELEPHQLERLRNLKESNA